jgi:hypothetical protein
MAASLLLNPETKIVAHPDQLASDLDGEMVLLHMSTGLYYGMNPVASRIWALVQEPTTPTAIQATLLEEYDVTPDVCQAQVMELLGTLMEANLIQAA